QKRTVEHSKTSSSSSASPSACDAGRSDAGSGRRRSSTRPSTCLTRHQTSPPSDRRSCRWGVSSPEAATSGTTFWQAFADLCKGGLTGWELHLAGSVHSGSASREYLARVKDVARGQPIRIHENLPYADLVRLYDQASLYWHAAGYGIDEEAHPEALEHFGMSTAEAMGRGAVPVVIARGGQLEVVRDGVDGRTWSEPG